MYDTYSLPTRPNLELKTPLKQLLGCLALNIVLSAAFEGEEEQSLGLYHNTFYSCIQSHIVVSKSMHPKARPVQ